MYVCVCVCPLQEIPRKLLKVVIIKLGTVTATGMGIYHLLIILTLTFKVTHILY